MAPRGAARPPPWHALADAAAVLGQGAGMGPLRLEAVVGAFAVASVAFIVFWRPRQPEAVVEEAPSLIVTGAPASPRTTDKAQADAHEQIDRSKYTD